MFLSVMIVSACMSICRASRLDLNGRECWIAVFFLEQHTSAKAVRFVSVNYEIFNFKGLCV